jgi:hypothetical protein
MSGRSFCLLVPSPRSSEEELQDNLDKTSSEDHTSCNRCHAHYSVFLFTLFASLEPVGAVSEVPLYSFARVGAPEMRSVLRST